MSKIFFEKLNNFVTDFYLKSENKTDEDEQKCMGEALEAIKAAFFVHSATLFRLMTDEKKIFEKITHEFSQRIYLDMEQYYKDITEVFYNE